MKLREVISTYARWEAALALAVANGTLNALEATDYAQQLKAAMRAWLGEELLEREL